MIRKTMVLLLVLGMCVLPTLSVMAYPVHAVYRTYVILDADYNVCSVLTVFEGYRWHDHILRNGQDYRIDEFTTSYTDQCN
jgi:hypothetical protein